MNKYLKFEYWNTCDLGNIYYQGGQHFIFYLDADVGEPIHEEVEEGQENGDGDFIPTYRRQMKRYRIRTGLIPDYLIDAIQRMKLHDHIELTFKSGEIEQIYNVDCEVEWQFEKYAWQGTVTLTFDMDESITVGACCDNLIIANPDPDPYWVATDGSDETGTGEYSNPWLTLSYAISQVTTGDTINLKAGTYNIGTQISIPVGVSIKGQGDNTVILATAALEPMFLLSSIAENTPGNQTISYIKFDGDMTALHAFSIRRRGNVVFDHITMVDFLYVGIEYCGGSSFTAIPTTYASGNAIRNSTITNCCSRRDPGNFGAIRFGGTIGMEIDNCVLTQTGRAVTENGNLLYLWGATNKALKFHDNICTKPTTDGVISGNAGGWNFHIESGYSHGYEIYNNTFVGGVALDLAGGNQVKGDYDYSWYVHDNDFSLSSQITKPTAGTHSPMAMDFERTCEDVIVERNIFRNYPTAINFTTSSSDYIKRRIYFRYNIFRNAGYADADYAYHIVWQGASDATGNLAYEMYFYNNVFHANLGRAFFGFLCAYNLNDIYIRNNVFVNAHLNGWMIVPLYCGDLVTLTGAFTGMYIDNNLMYNNANSNNIRYVDGKTMTIVSYADNILGEDPLFVSTTDFHLQAGSPCINAGIDVGLTTDYDGQAVSDPPEIGAYEYQE
jgi:hypothetical protein